MLIGDPYKFSIFVQKIQDWNLDEAFCNGILFFSIDGMLFPKKIVTVSLKCEVPLLEERLRNITENDELYFMSKKDAYLKIYNLVFPEDYKVDNDYKYDITPQSLADNNCYVFAIRNDENVRIIAANLKYTIEESRHNLSNFNISETFITINELNKMISKIDVY